MGWRAERLEAGSWKAGELEGWRAGGGKDGRPEGWRLEGWRAGRLEGWRAGRLEGWRAGRLEGGRAGRQAGDGKKTSGCFKVGRPNATAVRPSANYLFKLFKCPGV